jgi:anti-sigma B factor antagonist
MLRGTETQERYPEGVQVEVLTRKQGPVSIVSMSGRLTLDVADEKLGKPFREMVDAGDRLFVFEMTGVPYVDSAGVGELVACAKRAYERGGVIRVVSPSGSKARHILALTGLEKVFPTFDTENDAVAGFSG